ncbi:MAG TPA: hypothetical protein VG937_25090 [Polyangiaceae bacterium]|nr:hypothetical protein [Polyangiaceae bacterium]
MATPPLPPARGALLRRIQRQLEHFYAIERHFDVVDFVREVDDAEREVLLVREDHEDDVFELALLLPGRLMEPDSPRGDDLDGLLQALEGVSHFVYLTERVRANLPTTLLELELQAEVDKFVLLALEGEAALDEQRRAALCERLFERVRFLDDPGSAHGERYRLANNLAARYVRRLDPGIGGTALRARLRRFYRAGQTEKIHLAHAA